MPEPIRTLFKPSLADFREATDQYRAPVKITGETDQWPACREWSIPGMAQRFGDAPIKAMRLGSDGVARLDPETGFDGLYQEMGLRAFVESCGPGSASRPIYYWNQSLLEAPFTALRDEIATPLMIEPGASSGVYMWVGPRGCVSPLHYDLPDNIFCQVRGEKSFRLFSPDDSRYLSPHDETSKIGFVSRIDPVAPDLTLFPEYRHATPVDLIMKEGETLFVPARWWHLVTSLTDSISVNFWYHRKLKAS